MVLCIKESWYHVLRIMVLRIRSMVSDEVTSMSPPILAEKIVSVYVTTCGGVGPVLRNFLWLPEKFPDELAIIFLPDKFTDELSIIFLHRYLLFYSGTRHNGLGTDPENSSLWWEGVIQKGISLWKILYKNTLVCFLDPPSIIHALKACWIAHNTVHRMTDNVINSSMRVQEVLRNILKLNSNTPYYSNRRPTEKETSCLLQNQAITIISLKSLSYWGYSWWGNQTFGSQ